MKGIGEFLVLRYSLVEEAQKSIHVEKLPTPKGASAKAALAGDSEFLLNGVKYDLAQQPWTQFQALIRAS